MYLSMCKVIENTEEVYHKKPRLLCIDRLANVNLETELFSHALHLL